MGRPDQTPIRLPSTNGVDLATYHFGGTGPTLVISHATGFHARTYLPLIEQFMADFDVWGVDYRGHGRSTPPDDDNFVWTGFAADLLNLIDHIGVGPVRVFGHSMGGTAALLAERARPGTVTTAWLYEPIIFPPDIVPRNSMMAAAAIKRRAEFSNRAEALYRYASRPPLGALRADALAAYVEGGFVDTADGTVTLACTPAHEAATFENAGIGVDVITGLEPRAIIACGRAADPNPAEFAGPTAEALPNATLMAYDRLGHFGPLQDPGRIATDAAAFLAD